MQRTLSRVSKVLQFIWRIIALSELTKTWPLKVNTFTAQLSVRSGIWNYNILIIFYLYLFITGFIVLNINFIIFYYIKQTPSYSFIRFFSRSANLEHLVQVKFYLKFEFWNSVGEDQNTTNGNNLFLVRFCSLCWYSGFEYSSKVYFGFYYIHPSILLP